MKMTKRIIALVLAVAMMVTSLPTIASAATKTPTLNGKGLMKWGEKQTIKIKDIDSVVYYDGSLGRDYRVYAENIAWTTDDNTVVKLTNGTDSITAVENDFVDPSVDAEALKAGIVTLKAAVTYQKQTRKNLFHSWDNDGNSWTETYEMPIVVIDDVEIEVGETFDVNAYKSNWGDSIYNWTSYNTNIATVDGRGKITGVDEGTTTVKASINTLIFGWELYSVEFSVTVKEKTVDPEDPTHQIKCGEYDVYPGDEFTLKINDVELDDSDIKANGQGKHLVPQIFVANNGSISKYTVSEEATPGTYRIEFTANKPKENKGKVYYWIINVLENKVDLILNREGDQTAIVVPDYCNKDEAELKISSESDDIAEDLAQYLDGYTIDSFEVDNNGNIVVTASKIRFTISFAGSTYTTEVITGESLNETQKAEINRIAQGLVPRKDADYDYVFDYVAINNEAKDQFDFETAIVDNLELTVVYHAVAIEKVEVAFYQRKGTLAKPEDVKLADRQVVTMEKAVVEKMSDDAIVEYFANTIGDNVVKTIIRDDAEYKVVLRSNRYRFAYLEEGVDKENSDNRNDIKKVGEFYVLDRVNNENYTKEQEYNENAAAIIEEFGLDASIRIEGSEESWIHKLTEYFKTYAADKEGTEDNYSRFNLWFTKRIENPIDIEHRIYFNNVAMSNDQGAQVYPTETIIVEEAGKTVEQEKIDHTNKDAVKAAYIKYALPTCHVDENYLGVESVKYVPTDNGAKIVITYWAKRINVQYEGFDAEGKSVGEIKDEWHKIVNYMDYDHAEMSKYLNVLDENNKPQTISFNGVQYRLNADNSTAEGKHSCTGTTGKKDDFNVVTIKLAYDFDVQGNCEHQRDTKFEDQGTTHDLVTYCPLCEYEFSRETGLDHRYSMKHEEGLKCIDCGHDRTFEATIEATPRSVANFDEETIARMIAEAKEEFIAKTNEYFESIAEQGEHFAPVEAKDLEDLVMEEVTTTDTAKRFEGCILVNDRLIKYVLNISLMSGGNGGGSNGGSGSKGTRIGDGPVAQGSELLNDLRLNRPNDLITRAEFVGVLANIFQVPEDRIYDKAWNLEECTEREQIERLATYYIVKGYSDEEFGQNDTITLEQMYTIISRALLFQQKVELMTDEEVKATLETASYTMQVSDWAERGVSIAMKAGIAAAAETAPTEPQNGVMRITAADTLQKYIEVVAAPTEEVKVAEEK